MDPYQNNQTPPPDNYSVDYLDQIAVAQGPKGPSPKVMMAAIGGGILSLIIFGMMIFGGGQSTVDKWTALYLRINTLESTARQQANHLKDGEIREINRRLLLFLSNAQNDVKAGAERAGMSTNKIPDRAKNREATHSSELSTKFEDARVKVTLDRTYAREMAYEIGTLNSLMQQVYNASGNNTKEMLEGIHTNLASAAKQFSEFEDTK